MFIKLRCYEGLEGVLIATRDVTFHSLTYLVTGSALLAYQVREEKRAVQYSTVQ